MDTYRKVVALVDYTDGTSIVAEYKLSNGLSFSLGEMEKWIREIEGKKKIKSVSFIKKKE